MTFVITPELSRRFNPAQYLDTEPDPAATATYGNRYLFGDLDHRTLSATLRATVVFTPRLSFELYLQPLTSSIHYRSVVQLVAPRTFDFAPTGRDPAEYSSNVVSLRGSAVLRWEYRPGSTLYLVWNGNQSREEDGGRFEVGRSVRALGGLAPDHVFMAKLTYWWNR
jgi:hypothetical protein